MKIEIKLTAKDLVEVVAQYAQKSIPEGYKPNEVRVLVSGGTKRIAVKDEIDLVSVEWKR